ncbi:MAG TPA: class I SAM-dependent methyltransferase [Ktedonobacterales bacterium]
MEVEIISCPVCVSSTIKPYAARIRPGGPHFLRVRCARCGLIFANPQATKGQLEAFYQSYYDKGNFEGWKEETRSWKRTFDPARPTNEIRRLMRHIPQPQGKRWLEIGAGLGKASYQAQRLGFDVAVTELDPDAEHFLRTEMGIDTIYMGDFLDLDLPDEHYDVVLIHHVLEHVNDPIATLKAINRVLAPGGIVFIGVPNMGNAGYRALRMASYMRMRIPDIVDGIEHTFGFTPRTIRTCLERSGFAVKRIETLGLEQGLRLRPKALFENIFHVKMEITGVKPAYD